MGVDVRLDRDLGFTILVKQLEDGGRAAAVLIGDEQEGRRRVRRQLVRDAVGTRVDHDEEIRARTDAIDGIGRVGIRRYRVESNHRDHLAAGGETHDADAIGVDPPFGGAAAHQAQGPLSILARMYVDRVWRALFAREAVLQGEGSDTYAVEELGGLDALGVEDKFAVSAARADHHRGAGGLLFRRQEDGDRGIVDVADPVVLGEFRFVAAAFKTGRTVWPERDDLALRVGGGTSKQR